MQATAHRAIVGLLGVMLGSCAWQPMPSNYAHVPSEKSDTAAGDNAKCQSSVRCRVPTGNGGSTDLTDPWLDGLHARHLSDDVIESSTGERGL